MMMATSEVFFVKVNCCPGVLCHSERPPLQWVCAIIIIIITRPGPAFGRPGLEGIVGTCTLRDGYTPDASLRACGAQLGREGSLLFGAMG